MVTFKKLLYLRENNLEKQLIRESDFYQEWCSQLDLRWSPEETAFAGGLISNRLAFLFISAYQAAIRRTFMKNNRSWTALAISEDLGDKNPMPGLKESNGRVNGFKTWVASSKFSEDIIVSIDGTRLYAANRKTHGLKIFHKKNLRFLKEMSQGVVEFKDVAISDLEAIKSVNLKLFAKREPLYLYFAFCGFLTRMGVEDNEPLLDNLLTIASGNFTDPSHKTLFAYTDIRINEIFNNLDPKLFSGNYDKDKGLMSLYSKIIRKRAGMG